MRAPALLLLLLLSCAAAAPRQAAASPRPLTVLYDSWLYLPHSYAVTSAFELLHLRTAFPSLKLLVREPVYYQPAWQRSLAFSERYNGVLRSLEQYNGTQSVDLVLRRSYPHQLTTWPGEELRVPLLLFYTAEAGPGGLPATNFALDAPTRCREDGPVCWPELGVADVRRRLKSSRNLRLLTPSTWSAQGAAVYQKEPPFIVPHGVDTSLFRRLTDEQRAATRTQYGMEHSDFLILSVGAMTRNKGMIPLLRALHSSVHGAPKPRTVLMLKGMGALYDSKKWLESFFWECVKEEAADSSPAWTAEEVTAYREQLGVVFASHILFLDTTLSAASLNELYNAADLVAAPYHQEGFSLTPLEALAAGTPVLVPRKGGAADYLADLHGTESGPAFVHFLASDELEAGPNGGMQNVVRAGEVADIILRLAERKKAGAGRPGKGEHAALVARILAHWSWTSVAVKLHALFQELAPARPKVQFRRVESSAGEL